MSVQRLNVGMKIVIVLWIICSIIDSTLQQEDNYVHKCLGRLHDTGETSVEIPQAFMSNNATKVFSLKRKELNCKKGRFKVLLLLDDSSQGGGNEGRAKVLKTDRASWTTISYTDLTVKIMQSGYLHIGSDYFHPDEYCFDQTLAIPTSNELSLFVCNPECYGLRPCVTKCCAEDQVWDVKEKSCVPVIKPINSTKSSTNPFWEPTLFSQPVDNCVKKLTAYHRSHVSVHLRQSLPSCPPEEYKMIPLRKIHNHAVQRFRVLWTGDVILRDRNGNWSGFQHGRFCVDGMVNFGEGSSEYYSGAFEDQVLVVCSDQVPVMVQKKPIPIRYAAMLLAAAVILFITGLISALVWDHQSVYEWTVTCEVISMFFLILFVGVAHTIARRPEKSDFGSMHCVFVGAASHFFWMATFCWLFIINFEIWWNFRTLVQLRKSRKWFRFCIYTLVGWGCPLVGVLFGLLLDRTWGLQNEDLDCKNIIVPNYGQVNCYIAKKAQGPYLFYPIGVILGFNLIFYLLTVCKMWGYQKKSQAIIQYRSRGQTQPILIFAKLFIVMGVSWIFEIVSWALTPLDADKVPLYWVIFDVVTLFQAISIFFIFVWKKEVLSRFWYKYPVMRPLLSPLTKIPSCSVIPNERDRVASLYRSPNKLNTRGNNAQELADQEENQQVAFSSI